MAATDILDKIEETFKVEDITLLNGRKLWPFLRQKIFFDEVRKSMGYDNKLRTRNKKQLLFNFFYGFKHLFRLNKFDYVFFNNADKRILQQGNYFDIFFDAWADKLDKEKSLFVEWAIGRHHKSEAVHSSNVISDLPFKVLVSVVSRFTTSKIKHEAILNQIIIKNGLSPSFKKEIKTKLAELYVYKFLFKIIKPKAVFILSSFTKVSVVTAAKELGIQVYEAQHGHIGDTHAFYNVKKQFKETYPDYLISFGTYEKEKGNLKSIFTPDQIIPVGSFQLELIKDLPLPKKLTLLKNKYKLVFCVALQVIKEEEILNWVVREANLHKDWLFVIRAKDRGLDYSTYTKLENITELKENSIYEVLKIANYNITIYSTTAIEGIYLGAEPIFYNINNLSRDHFDIEKMNAIVINDGAPLTTELFASKTKKDKSFFVEDYLENVKKASLDI